MTSVETSQEDLSNDVIKTGRFFTRSRARMSWRLAHSCALRTLRTIRKHYGYLNIYLLWSKFIKVLITKQNGGS